jgi:serine/threonine protein phosphatase PrpC
MKDEKNSDNKIKIINQNDNSKIRFLKGDIFHNVNNSESNEQEEIKIQRIQTFDKERRNKFTHIIIPTFRKINSLNISEENEINKFNKKIKIKNKNKIHLNKKEINFELNEKKINEDINNNNINFNNINKHEVKNETNNTKNNNNNKIIIKKQIPQSDMKQENVLNSNNINKNNNIENNNNKNKNDNNQKESNYNSIIKDFSKYEFANIEIRKQMEDFTYTNLNFHNKNNHNISLFAIYDGHNGKLVSEYLYKNFDKILLSNLEKTNYQIRKSLIDSFQQINSNFEKNPEAKNTGSTATVILIDNNNLYCANVGDSQCYYISKEKIIKLTKIHNCNDLKEVERIKKKNGIIFQNRIFGCINLTRTIGDIEFKEYGVTCIPDISKEILSENNSKYIILGSDGVWDVIDENDIINIEKKYGNNCKDFCKKIIKTAIEKKSQDNISCIVIKF